jgi:hypothetical protein
MPDAPEAAPERSGGAGEAIPPEATEGARDAPATPEESAKGESTEVARLRRENANRRGALREVEAERDRLREQVAAFQRAEVERMAADVLADGSDLWRHDGIELAALLGDDGAPDAERVAKAVAAVGEAHPAWRRASPDFGAGVRRPVEAAPSFGEAFKQAGRG